MNETLFLRLLSYEDKSTALADSVKAVQEGRTLYGTEYVVNSASFSQIPGSTFAYWVSERIRRKFVELPQFESHGRVVRVGDHPGDGFRYIRLFWEIPAHSGEHDWVPYQKGGTYAPYYCDIHLLVDWDASRQTYREFYGRPGRPNERPSNYQYFFLPGLTWPRRTTSGISIRILPQGCVFADKGPAAFVSAGDEMKLLALMNTQIFEALVALQLGAADAAARSYEVGLIQKVPVPELVGANSVRLGELAINYVHLKRNLDTANEISHVFHLPALLQVKSKTLLKSIISWQAQVNKVQQQLTEYQYEIDKIAFKLYGITDEDRWAIEESQKASQQSGKIADGEPEMEDDIAVGEDSVDIGSLITSLLSYAVGCVLGRWDIRFATGERTPSDLPDPFATLPACAPGMLTNNDGLPRSETPLEYPLEINWEGILVDDYDHRDDIVRCVQEVLRVIWQDCAEAIEQEACQIIEVKELCEYFHRSSNGGFWMDHIRRYSKSRRKAPIYWLLQSAKRNYAIWIYYHRLEKDTLFKVLTKYVEPKIRLEDSSLEQWRVQLATAGNEGREVKQLERQLERQESLVTELYEFRDKLRRAADLNLEPDLNDGVVLNIAPLWELVPWGEAKKYWDELLARKYEWSSISKQLRVKGVI